LSPKLLKTLSLIIALSILAACAPQGATPAAPTAKLTLGAYTTPREAYAELTPLFASQWKEKTGDEVTFEESYLGSGAQSRAIVAW
jgi:ABC-type sulfate transport system substrate-binding protein